MRWCGAHRRLVWVLAAVIVALAAGAVWLWTLPTNSDGLKVGDFGADEQQDWARRLVTGLNTSDAEQVPVLRLNGQLSREQRKVIDATLPAAGCRYVLQSVTDRGKQTGKEVPGLPTAQSIYRFDAAVDEECEGRPSRSRDIGVLAIVDMGYWEPYYFE